MAVVILAGVAILAGVIKAIGIVARRRERDRVSEKWLDDHVGTSGKQ
jgi:hypothetical protein